MDTDTVETFDPEWHNKSNPFSSLHVSEEKTVTAQISRKFPWSRYRDAAGLDKTTRRRIAHEYARNLLDAHKRPGRGFALTPSPDAILEWHAIIDGESGTPLEGGEYHLSLSLPPDYPWTRPTVVLHTENGKLRYGVALVDSNSKAYGDYSPAWSLTDFVEGIRDMMHAPYDASCDLCVQSTDEEVRAAASESHEHIMQNTVERASLSAMFPYRYTSWYGRVWRSLAATDPDAAAKLDHPELVLGRHGGEGAWLMDATAGVRSAAGSAAATMRSRRRARSTKGRSGSK